MLRGPSLTSHTVTVSRRVDAVDVEGSPVSTYVDIVTFLGGFGELATGKETVLGFNGQRVDAAVSTLNAVDVKIHDRVSVNGGDWVVVGVKATPLTTRILLASWGS